MSTADVRPGSSTERSAANAKVRFPLAKINLGEGDGGPERGNFPRSSTAGVRAGERADSGHSPDRRQPAAAPIARAVSVAFAHKYFQKWRAVSEAGPNFRTPSPASRVF